MVDQIKNFAYGTVATAPSPSTSGTSMVLGAGQGAGFPTTAFTGVTWPVGQIPSISNAEVLRCTGLSGVSDTVTIVRQQEGSSAQPIAIGFQFAQVITGGLIAELLANPNGFYSGTYANLSSVVPSPVIGNNYYATDLGFEMIYTGSVWKVAPGTLLASTVFSPGSQHTYSVLSDSSMTALDTVNLTLSFPVPPSGNVDIDVQIDAYLGCNGSGNTYMKLGIFEHGTTTLLAPTASALNISNNVASTTAVGGTVRALFRVTGQTPGATLSIDLCGCCGSESSAALANFYAFGDTSGSPLSGEGTPAIIRALAA